MLSNATYTISANTPQAAFVSLLKNKLQIDLQYNEEQRSLYWHYDEILKDKESDLVFAHLSYPLQIIAVNDATLANELNKKISRHKKKILTNRRSIFIKLIAAFVVFVLTVYFILLPWVASLLVNRFPVDYEKSLGEQMYNSMKEDLKIDASKTLYLNEFFKQLNIPSAYNIQITVVHDDIANAYAMPGGHIIVHDQIIKDLKTYPELAALLSHEFTHIEKRHSLKSLLRQLSTHIFLSLILEDAGTAGNVLVANANNLKTLSYSRSLEKEADENGAALLVQRGIDCKGFVHLFEALKKEETAQKSEWSSSHPALDNRIKNIKRLSLCNNQNVNNDPVLEAVFQKIKSHN